MVPILGATLYSASSVRTPPLLFTFLNELLMYVKFTNFVSYVWKVRTFCLFSIVSVSVHPNTQQN